MPPRPLPPYFRDLPVPGTYTPRPMPQKSADEIARALSQSISADLYKAGSGIAQALMAPGNAMRGSYDQREVYPDGSVSQFDPRMIDDASNMAGFVSLGAMPFPRPVGSLGMGASVHRNADLLAQALRDRNIGTSSPSHSINRHGEYSSYIDTPLGQVRVSDHSKNSNFDTSAMNIMDMGGPFNVQQEADIIASLVQQQRAMRASDLSAKNAAIAPLAERYKSAQTNEQRISVLREAIDSGIFGGPRYSELSRDDRQSIARRLLNFKPL